MRKHGKGLSPAEYTQKALKCFNNPKTSKTIYKDMQGRDTWKVKGPDGVGLFTLDGKIIWFHPAS